MLLLHHDHHSKLAPADGFAPPFRLTGGGSTVELRGNMKWSARSDLHAQGCLILSQVGLLFPVNHAPKNWSLWSDSHRRLRVYETRPVASGGTEANGVRDRNFACDLHLRRVALCKLSYADIRWRARRDAHPLVIRLERATARRLCAQEQWSGRPESRRQPARCERAALLIELRPEMAAPDGFAPPTSGVRDRRSAD